MTFHGTCLKKKNMCDPSPSVISPPGRCERKWPPRSLWIATDTHRCFFLVGKDTCNYKLIAIYQDLPKQRWSTQTANLWTFVWFTA